MKSDGCWWSSWKEQRDEIRWDKESLRFFALDLFIQICFSSRKNWVLFDHRHHVNKWKRINSASHESPSKCNSSNQNNSFYWWINEKESRSMYSLVETIDNGRYQWLSGKNDFETIGRSLQIRTRSHWRRSFSSVFHRLFMRLFSNHRHERRENLSFYPISFSSLGEENHSRSHSNGIGFRCLWKTVEESQVQSLSSRLRLPLWRWSTTFIFVSLCRWIKKTHKLNSNRCTYISEFL